MEFRSSALEGMGLNLEFWRNRKVFLTGHTGFKGAWLCLYLRQLGAHVTGFALPPSTTPNLFEAAGVARGVDSIEGDIRDLDALKGAMRKAAPEIVFHLAAQSLVRRSYVDPLETYMTNVIGTVNALEAFRATSSACAMVVVTSDKCYEEHSDGRAHRESDPLGGHDPYAASKACAEIVSSSYRRSFFSGAKFARAVASVRAGNVIGGGDWAEDRLLPDLVRAFAARKSAQIRNPHATRPWQHVLDPLSGYLLLAERLAERGRDFAEAWNFGPLPGQSTTVGDVVGTVARLWGAGASIIVDETPQPREAPLLALDAAKARSRLGWKPRLSTEDALAWTIAWYRDWYANGQAQDLANAQIERYLAVAEVT